LGLGLVFKLGLFSVATACVPAFVRLSDGASKLHRVTQAGLAYLFAVLFGIEVVFLTIEYA
jgi:hypothetical protein